MAKDYIRELWDAKRYGFKLRKNIIILAFNILSSIYVMTKNFENIFCVLILKYF